MGPTFGSLLRFRAASDLSRPIEGAPLKKPARISRIWVNRDGMWRMAFSYQTTIQSAPPIVPPTP
jgi:hypothetical protein